MPQALFSYRTFKVIGQATSKVLGMAEVSVHLTSPLICKYKDSPKCGLATKILRRWVYYYARPSGQWRYEYADPGR